MKFRIVKSFIAMAGTHTIHHWKIVKMEGEELFTLLNFDKEQSKHDTYYGAHYKMVSQMDDFLRTERNILIKG